MRRVLLQVETLRRRLCVSIDINTDTKSLEACLQQSHAVAVTLLWHETLGGEQVIIITNQRSSPSSLSDSTSVVSISRNVKRAPVAEQIPAHAKRRKLSNGDRFESSSPPLASWLDFN